LAFSLATFLAVSGVNCERITLIMIRNLFDALVTIRRSDIGSEDHSPSVVLEQFSPESDFVFRPPGK